MEAIVLYRNVVLAFESVDQNLLCDDSNETSSAAAVLLHSAICFSIFSRMKFGIFLEF